MIRRWADRVVDEEAGAIRETLRAGSNPLDEFLPPGALLQLLRNHRRGAWQHGLHRRAARTGRRLMGRLTGNGHGSWIARPLPESVLLVRALFLRELFEERLSPVGRPVSSGERARRARSLRLPPLQEGAEEESPGEEGRREISAPPFEPDPPP